MPVSKMRLRRVGDGRYAHVEIDLSRQVLFVIDETGMVMRILPVSTGNGELYMDHGQVHRARTPTGFASKVGSPTWKRSVPPAVAGGCVAMRRRSITSLEPLLRILCGDSTTCLRAAHPPATAGGTDLFQVRLLTFEARPPQPALSRCCERSKAGG